MATFNPLYTGKDSAVKVPELNAIEKSSQRNSELAIRGTEMELQRSVNDRNAFIKMLDVDPVAATTDWNTKRQALAYEKHLNNATLIEQKSGGHPSTADIIKIQSSKNELISEQNRILAEQKQINDATELATRDTRGYYDHDAFYNNLKEYNKTGKLPIEILPVAPQSMTAWLRGQSKTLPRTTNPEQRDVLQNGKPTGQRVLVDVDSGSKEDAQNIIMEGLKEPARQKQMILDFDAWSKKPENQQAYSDLLKDYDRHKNGVVSPEENQYAHSHIEATDNPIVQWAINNPEYLRSAMNPQDKSSKNIPTAGKGTTFNWNLGVNAGNNKNNSFDNQGLQKIASVEGDFDLPDYRNLGQVSQTSETQNIPEVVTKDANGNETTKPLNETALFHVVGFSPSKDRLVIQLDGNSSGNMTYSKGDVLVVPASGFNDLLQKKPFGIFRGQKTATQLVRTTSGVTWAAPKKK